MSEIYIIQKVMGWENYHMYEFQIGDIIITSEEAGFNARNTRNVALT